MRIAQPPEPMHTELGPPRRQPTIPQIRALNVKPTVRPLSSSAARDREPPPQWDLDGLLIAAVDAEQAWSLLDDSLAKLRAHPEQQLLLLMTPTEFHRGEFDASQLGRCGVGFALEADVSRPAAELWVHQFRARHHL